MNKEFLDTLYLFACGANGVTPDAEFKFDIKNVYSVSQKQGVWETVFLAVSELKKINPECMPDDIYNIFHRMFTANCIEQYKRQGFIHNLLDVFEKNNIEPCILKGENIARFYNTPIARISGDVDVLINPSKAAVCLKILKEHGFDVGKKVYESHQIKCSHPVAGLVEIHTRMYGRMTEDITFKNEVKYDEPYIEVKSEYGGSYKTLGYTDNFVFIFLHFIKHFLSSGVGLRQLADVLLYVKHNYNNIDWIKADGIMEKLGFKKIFLCLISIGEKYFMFPENLFKTDSVSEDLCEKIFEDMFKGGVFGYDDEERKDFYDIYLRERCKKAGMGDLDVYKNKRKLTRLFPDAEFMAINFPYVKKTKLLLPVAWIHRIIKGVSEKNGEENESISSAQGKRLEMLRELDMI